ncbi:MULTISPECIES: hypothetical protein [unclassified Wolbachia]|uniref:hypothetical protein n=1 Tax=unclassified Wolbachia TaxID=2640676 RepID=UPI000B319C07|nr:MULTISPECIES: hypothetical protein [unclassified Wolbachia]
MTSYYTAANRHTAIHSRYLKAANKQRDDGCQASASTMSSQCPDTGIQESLLVNKQTSIEKRFR